MSDVHVWRNDDDVTPISEWTMTWSEGTGGVNEALVVLQNRGGDPALDFLERDIFKITKGSWVLYEGEAVRPSLELPVGMPWRRWKLSLTDWNTVPDLRLINTADDFAVHPGGDANLESGDPKGPYAIDPDAIVSATDRATIQAWYDAYVRAPDNGAFDTDAFVRQYLDDAILYDGITGEPNFVPSPGAIKGAIAGISGLAPFPIYDWIDPDRKVHHEAFDDDHIGDAPAAPCIITDQRSEWDGVTKIGGRGLHIDPDLTYGPQDCWVNGRTPFKMLAADDAANISLYGGRFLEQGTGWGHGSHAKNHRQVMVGGQAVTRTQRDAISDGYTAYADRPRYTGGIIIGGRDDEGNGLPLPTGFRAGQILTIVDERLVGTLFENKLWPIRRINGELVAGHHDIITLDIEFGDMPLADVQQNFANDLEAQRLVESRTAVRPKAAPRHVIGYDVLNPRPGLPQTLTSQARDSADRPVTTAGLAVHWEFVSVLDRLGNDMSGNGESLDPTDTVTNEDGSTTTTFTAGSLGGVYYLIEASTPYQDL